ncbi:MAG: CHAT domain-containing protein [Acidobacteria bacterium]|nr:CHAT domain-containing protein [Acidobacteriota bacterium]
MSWWTLPRLTLTVAALSVLAVAGYLYQEQRNPQKHVAQLLAQAATQRRFSELRMEGAGFAPVGEGLKREPGSSFLGTPGELLKAEALIYDQLSSHPSDSYWLHAQAKADLLDGKVDAAQATLTRALQLSPKSPEILTDLATTYFQQKDYAASYEKLSEVLSLRANDPLALFNRAVVSEKQFLYRQALDDWDSYLKVDPNSQWAAEARERADSIRKKLQQHEKSRAEPLLSPAQLADSSHSANQTAETQVDERIDEYLVEALRTWLPKAYPGSTNQADPTLKQALFFLADLTARRHSDLWLTDLLRGSSKPNFPEAVAALSEAVRDDRIGEFARGRQQAERAQEIFRASGNAAGALRASFEQAYSAQFRRDIETCERQASSALAESERYSYPWLHIQLGLEKGLCLGFNGNIGSDERIVRTAMKRAQQSGYRALFLRTVTFVAEGELEIGDSSAAWRLLTTGMEQYWSGQFPVMQAYSYYSEYSVIAESVGRPHLQLATMREGVQLIDSDPDLSLRAVAHDVLSHAALAAQQPMLAEQQLLEAARLYALAPQTEATNSDRLESQFRMAQIEARQNKFDDALHVLASVQPEIERSSTNYLKAIFYSTLGEVQLRRGDGGDAEQALWKAISFSEFKLASLKSEQRTIWNRDAAPNYRALAEAELTQGRNQEGLEIYEWHLNATQHPGSRLDRADGKTADIPSLPVEARLESRLPLLSHVTVFSYGFLPDGLAIWAYDDRGLQTRWFPGDNQQLQELLSRFHNLTSDPHSEMGAVRRDARSLYQLLIAPMEDRLSPERTLVIESEGSLAQFPFEALLDSQGHYLIERMPIVHSLGTDTDTWRQTEASISATLPALIVGSTASSQVDGIIQLPDIEAEADTVARAFHSARVLKGSAASLDRVKSELPGAVIFHFAGHSLFTRDNSGLLLTGGDTSLDRPVVLDVAALEKLDIKKMQLAVLSACSTATGDGGTRGFTSILETLLLAEVPHVVASRWAVDSAESRRFIEGYYQNLLSGSSVSEAARLTSRKMLADPRTAHPFYWSAFAAYGRP